MKSKPRQYLDKDRGMILWLFDNRCLMCGKPTNIIHEIIPISHGKASLHWKNRVPLCDVHHIPWAHGIGTNNTIPILQEKRKQFLIRKFDLNDQFQEKENVKEIDTEPEILVEGNGKN